MNRTRFLLAAASVLAVLAIGRFFWPDGTITVDFKDAPLARVVAAIERQGGVNIVTNVPPETPVTLQLRRAPLFLALETLATRVDGDLRPAVIATPSRAATRAAIAAFEANVRPEGFVISWFPGGFVSGNSTPVDPRALVVTFEPAESNDLQSSLRQISAKSGLMTAVPQDWNPVPAPPKKPAPASKMARSVVGAAKGDSAEVVLIIADSRDRWDSGGGGGERQAGERPQGAGAPSDRERSRIDPAWMAARAEATIAQLPPEEQPAAKADYESMRAFWQEVSALPEEQRRAKMSEFFNSPAVQDRMEERDASRDAQRSPEQRSSRYERYLQRKAAARQAQR